MILRKTICLVLLIGFVVFSGIACSKNSERSSTASSMSELDRDINEYEKLVNDYVKTMEKFNGGDLLAIAEATAILKNIEPILTKITFKVNEMTTEQQNKFVEITMKMQAFQ